MDYLNLSINETNKTKKGNSYLPQLSILFLAVRRCMTTYLLLKYLKRHINKVCFPIFILVFSITFICWTLIIGNWVLYKRGSDDDDTYLKFIIKFRKKENILNFILCNIFSSLKLSNFAGWNNSLEFLWCRYSSILLSEWPKVCFSL